MSLKVGAVLETLDVVGDKADEGGSLKLNIEYKSPHAENNVWLILVADKSGSMSGNPWKQVQGALTYMLKESYENYTNITADIITYNSNATRINFTQQNYAQVIAAERANGMTCFSAAYNTITDTLLAKEVSENTDVVVVFLTDGDDTSKIDPTPAINNLKLTIEALPCPVVFHAVGFTVEHKFDVLNDLRMIGKEQGMFQYAEPGDGRDALQKKLEGIFNYVSLSGSKVHIQVELDGHVFNGGLASSPVSTKDSVVRLEQDGTLALTYSVAPDTKGLHKDALSVRLTLVDGGTVHKATQKVELKVTSGTSAITQYKLRKMEQNLQDVIEKLGSHSAAPSDNEREQYLAVLKAVQQGLKEFDGPVVFRLPQADREPIIAQISAMHARLNQLFETIAAWARGQWTTVNRARLADIAYSNVFSKANRQRRMDARVATNAQRQKEDASKLQALVLDTEKLAKISEDSKSLFSCILSLCNWVELAQDKDVLGFGLAVLRPEWVVDDPTQLRVYNISTSLCSKSSIEDSIKYSIDVQGQVATTGGFGIGQEVGVATRGSGREPINAWLPLYIHSQHWEIIKINLRQILGYFVSLDPLGFAVDQVDAIFLVLGTMISRLTANPGERQLLILFQFMRTCLAVAEEMKWFDRIEEKLVATIEKIHYDVTDQAKNLLVLIGYLVILPEARLEKIFKKPTSMVSLWTAIMAIASRRSAFTMFNDLTEVHVRLFLDQLVYGKSQINYKQEGSGATTALEVSNLFGLTNAEDLTALASLENYDANEFPPNTMEAISQFSKAMNRFGYPTASALYSSLAFFFTWRDLQTKFPQHPQLSTLVLLDQHEGVTPNAWIETTKEVFTSIFSQRPPTIISYFELLNSRYPLPHPIEQIARAVVAQGVQYRVNKPAKEAFDSGVYMNTMENPQKCIHALHSHLLQQRQYALNSLQAAQRFQSMTAAAFGRQDLSFFVEDIKRVLRGGTRADIYFKNVYMTLQTHNARVSVPFAEFKLRVIITGKYLVKDDKGNVTQADALDGGALWIPGRINMRRFSEIYGHVEMEAIVGLAMSNNPKIWSH